MPFHFSKFVANRKGKHKSGTKTARVDTQSKSKIDRHTDGLLTLQQKIGDLEDDHIQIKKRLKSILKSFFEVEELGIELFLLLQFSGMESMSTDALEADSFPPPRHGDREQAQWTKSFDKKDYKEQTTEAGLALITLTLQMEDLAKDQDHIQRLISTAADFLNRKTCDLFEKMSVSSSQYDNDEIPGVFELIWNEFLYLSESSIAWRACGAPQCGEEGQPINSVPPVVLIFDSLAKELQAVHQELQLQMDQSDELLYLCQECKTKQNKFEKAWHKSDERALVLDNSDEAEGDVDVLVFLDERQVATE